MIRLTVHFQPYGTFTMSVDVMTPSASRGRHIVSGKVLSGTETSRLFQHTSTRDITGETREVYGVTDDELKAGVCTRVAM